jgi:pimeloyl-ACP methyl ester carboxylesterase
MIMEYQPSLYNSVAGQQAVMALYDRALAEWPIPFDGRYLETRHGRTFVLDCGPAGAPPLVLLHGAGTNSAIWIGDAPKYTQAYHVYAVDLIGEAGRSAPSRPSWDGLAYSEWLADVLEGLELARVRLAGISQGGWVGLKFGVAFPERIEQLALICPGGVVPDRLSFALKALPLSMAGDRGLRRLVSLMYGDVPVPEEAATVTAVVSRNFKSRVGRLPIFSDEELARLAMPVLLLGGSKDALRDMCRIADRLRGLLPELTVRIRPGAGHAILDTAGEVMGFLQRREPQAASFAT